MFCFDVIRSNSKEHSFLIKSADKKTKYGFSLSKFSSSNKDLRGNSQIGSFINLPFNQLPSLKDYKDNCLVFSGKESMYKSRLENSESVNCVHNVNGGGCFCEKEKCRIF